MDKNIVYILFIALLLAIGIIYIEANHSSTPVNSNLNILTPTPTSSINFNPQAGGQNPLNPAQAGNTPANSPKPKTLNDIEGIATIQTSKGNIVIQLDKQDAHQTVINFINKAVSGYYNGRTFHRVEDWVIQGGDPKGDGTGGLNNQPVELNNKPFVVGSLGQASLGDGKTQNDSQFFIVKQEADWLNNKYTNYGVVTSGMDVVNKIAIGDKIINITVQ